MAEPLLLAEKIAKELQADIVARRVAPGARLVERTLAQRFGVSSIPVREALQFLEGRGLAVKRPNRGYTVVELSTVELAQMAELRDLIEPKLMEWAAERCDETGVTKLRWQLRCLEDAAKKKDLGQFFEQDMVLHRTIWELAGNPAAARALEAVVGGLFACGMRTLRLDLMAEYELHQELVQRIEAGDGAGAREALGRIAKGFRTKILKEKAL